MFAATGGPYAASQNPAAAACYFSKLARTDNCNMLMNWFLYLIEPGLSLPMKRLLPSLSALVAFEAAARHASFARAGEELGLTASAISRQIAQLEGFLGVSLFERVRRAVVLTERGRVYAGEVRLTLDRAERRQRSTCWPPMIAAESPHLDVVDANPVLADAPDAFLRAAKPRRCLPDHDLQSAVPVERRTRRRDPLRRTVMARRAFACPSSEILRQNAA